MLYSELVNLIRPEVPNAPQKLIIEHIRNATIRFCDRSRWLERDLIAINVVAGEKDYELTAGGDYSIINLVNLFYDGNELIEKSEERIAHLFAVETPLPKYYLFKERGVIRLAGLPTAAIAGGLTGRAVIKPSRIAVEASDELFEAYQEPILAGAKFRLMSMPEKPWSSPEMAAYYSNEFISGIREARVEIRRAHGNRAQAIAGRAFV